MQRFKNILFLADGKADQHSALSRAVALARANQARLTVMDVVEPLGYAFTTEWEMHPDLDALAVNQRAEELAALVAPFREDGATIEVQVRQGTPFVEVIQTVQRAGHDLLIKTAQGLAGPLERLFGSTDLHLLRKCPCPVWVDKPQAALPYRAVLAAVNPFGSAGEALDRLIMDLAASLAEREAAQLHVVHAWRLEGEIMLRSGRARMPMSQVDDLVEQTRVAHLRRLTTLLAHYHLDPRDPRVHLLKGRAPTSIAGCAVDIGADLIVMGTVGRTGVPGLFIGNTAEEILQITTTSVLAVKPASFESPVKVDD